MFEKPECEDCQLHLTAKHRCLPSIGGQDCRLAIFLDNPAMIEDKRGRSFVSDNAEFVKFCLRRMSVSLDDVYMDYIVKCYPKKLPGDKSVRMECVRACSQYRFKSLKHLPHLQTIVALGALGCETFTLAKKIGTKQGCEWKPASPLMQQHSEHVWVGFSPGLLKEKPSEAGAIYRVIFMAAKEAGLKPRVAKIQPYDFQIV